MEKKRFRVFKKFFEYCKIDGDIIGTTPVGCGMCVRGNEIRYWLKDNKYEDSNYLILDDDSDMLLWQKDNFVHINNNYGLMEEHIPLSFKILNRRIK